MDKLNLKFKSDTLHLCVECELKLYLVRVFNFCLRANKFSIKAYLFVFYSDVYTQLIPVSTFAFTCLKAKQYLTAKTI